MVQLLHDVFSDCSKDYLPDSDGAAPLQARTPMVLSYYQVKLGVFQI